MKGLNKLEINEATMREAMELYLQEKLKFGVIVKSVRTDKTGSNVTYRIGFESKLDNAAKALVGSAQ